MIPDLLIHHIESLRTQTNDLERRLEKEKKRLQRKTDDLKNFTLVHGNSSHNNNNSSSILNKQNFDESFSESSCNNTQESVFSDNQANSLPTSARTRKSSSLSKYERPLLEVDNEKCRKMATDNTSAISGPIKIKGKPMNELVSSSGSYDSNNEDEIFKKPSLPARPKAKLDPLENRKYSQSENSSVKDEEEKKVYVKRTQSW